MLLIIKTLRLFKILFCGEKGHMMLRTNYQLKDMMVIDAVQEEL